MDIVSFYYRAIKRLLASALKDEHMEIVCMLYVHPQISQLSMSTWTTLTSTLFPATTQVLDN